MEFESVTLDIADHIAVVTLNDPETLNAVSSAMLTGLRAALDEVERDGSDARCLVLTGAGRGFSSGANLAEDMGPSDGVPDLGARLDKFYHPALERLHRLNIPIVTAVNGPAVGIGMSFALMGDIVLMARSAYFMLAFRRIGLVPDGGSTWLLPRLIGLQRAKELALLGDKLMPDQAHAWGLVNRVCDDDALMGAARELAIRLATGPTLALGRMRNLFNQGTDSTYEEQLRREHEAQTAMGHTADFMEGVTAFLEKRDARFEGR